MNYDLRQTFHHKLKRCGMYQVIDDFMAGEQFAALKDLAEPFRINIGPKGITILSVPEVPDGPQTEYAKRTFRDCKIPDMPSHLVHDFLGLVIEYCDEHHPEYQYRYAKRKLKDSEKNQSEMQQMARNHDYVPRNAPGGLAGRGNFGIQNAHGGDFTGATGSRPSAALGFHNTPRGDYRMDTRRTGRASTSSMFNSTEDMTGVGYIIGPIKK